VSKKKSYMNRKQVLNEGIISYTLDKIYKFFYLNPALRKSKKLNKSISKLNKSVVEFETTVNAELKSYGSKERVKIKPYTAKDLLSGKR
tara:strand:+ start:569 stop:835 length:267 start_codon:yes stop_codon:yes gene_type:complete